jgi:hypothetical protein
MAASRSSLELRIIIVTLSRAFMWYSVRPCHFIPSPLGGGDWDGIRHEVAPATTLGQPTRFFESESINRSTQSLGCLPSTRLQLLASSRHAGKTALSRPDAQSTCNRQIRVARQHAAWPTNWLGCSSAASGFALASLEIYNNQWHKIGEIDRPWQKQRPVTWENRWEG